MPTTLNSGPRSAAQDAGSGFRLSATCFEAIEGFASDNLLEAYETFMVSAEAVAAAQAPLRPGLPPSDAFRRLCRKSLGPERPGTREAARQWFEAHFCPYRIEPTEPGGAPGFLTGYYEPALEGSLERRAEFDAPILCRPAAYCRLPPGDAAEPYPVRAVIEAEAIAGRHPAVVWLRDWVEVFFVQVQGSGRVRLPDGQELRLVYDGRNGQPYSSIGRMLIESSEIDAARMSLARVKAWIRAHGQNEGDAGRILMQCNLSYVFFRAEPAEPGTGPIGGAGLPLTRLRSIAIDRTLWPYGLPFWIDADLPWEGPGLSGFRRLTVAQDTGSAILGPARADLYFGSGSEAGERAGDIRHAGRFTVFLPRDEPPPSASLGR